MIDRNSLTEELEGLGGDELLANLQALVDAGLIEERPGVAGTRFATRPPDED